MLTLGKPFYLEKDTMYVCLNYLKNTTISFH